MSRTCEVQGCGGKHRARGYCVTHYNKHVQGEAKRHPKEARSCVVCDTTVLRRADKAQHQATCSVQCRRIVQWGTTLAPESTYEWAVDAVKRARRFGAQVVEMFDRDEIFERDGWRCQLCDIKCSSPNPYALSSATVDHVMPLARGGEHSRANAQTLCLSCNASKQAAIAPAA